MKTLLAFFIKTIDALVVKFAGWTHIPSSRAKFLYLSPRKYKGTLITLRDGTHISAGDIVAELHIDNKKIRYLEVTYTNILKALHEELKALKKSLDQEPFSRIKAIYGVTVFHAMLQRQGFTVIDLKNPYIRVLGSIWENILRLVLKKSGKTARKNFVTAKKCWLSRGQIENMETKETYTQKNSQLRDRS